MRRRSSRRAVLVALPSRQGTSNWIRSPPGWLNCGFRTTKGARDESKSRATTVLSSECTGTASFNVEPGLDLGPPFRQFFLARSDNAFFLIEPDEPQDRVAPCGIAMGGQMACCSLCVGPSGFQFDEGSFYKGLLPNGINNRKNLVFKLRMSHGSDSRAVVGDRVPGRSRVVRHMRSCGAIWSMWRSIISPEGRGCLGRTWRAWRRWWAGA